MAETDWTSKKGEAPWAGEGGLVVRVQLRGLQPDPDPETAGAERLKLRIQPLATSSRRPRSPAEAKNNHT